MYLFRDANAKCDRADIDRNKYILKYKYCIVFVWSQ